MSKQEEWVLVVLWSLLAIVKSIKEADMEGL